MPQTEKQIDLLNKRLKLNSKYHRKREAASWSDMRFKNVVEFSLQLGIIYKLFEMQAWAVAEQGLVIDESEDNKIIKHARDVTDSMITLVAMKSMGADEPYLSLKDFQTILLGHHIAVDKISLHMRLKKHVHLGFLQRLEYKTLTKSEKKMVDGDRRTKWVYAFPRDQFNKLTYLHEGGGYKDELNTITAPALAVALHEYLEAMTRAALQLPTKIREDLTMDIIPK